MPNMRPTFDCATGYVFVPSSDAQVLTGATAPDPAAAGSAQTDAHALLWRATGPRVGLRRDGGEEWDEYERVQWHQEGCGRSKWAWTLRCGNGISVWGAVTYWRSG